MPEMTGTQFCEALRKHFPNLPILLITGYGGTLIAARATSAGVTRMLRKPLQRSELALALNELLALENHHISFVGDIL